MSDAHRKKLLATLFNLPNQLTSLRLLLAVVMFVMIGLDHYLTAFILFVIAAGTDWLDGYFARKYGLVTTLGRILDPFADKVIVCGAFIFLVSIPRLLEMPYGLRPWMVVVIVGRELLITALRSFFEERGSDFSAKMSGKLKMLLQCVAAAAALLYLALESPPQWLLATLIASTWSAVVVTAYSGIVYVWMAWRLLKSHD